jgi:hypothetical protein
MNPKGSPLHPTVRELFRHYVEISTAAKLGRCADLEDHSVARALAGEPVSPRTAAKIAGFCAQRAAHFGRLYAAARDEMDRLCPAARAAEAP